MTHFVSFEKEECFLGSWEIDSNNPRYLSSRCSIDSFSSADTSVSNLIKVFIIYLKKTDRLFPVHAFAGGKYDNGQVVPVALFALKTFIMS